MFNKNPRTAFEAQYKHDVQQLGQSPNALTEDNFLTISSVFILFIFLEQNIPEEKNSVPQEIKEPEKEQVEKNKNTVITEEVPKEITQSKNSQKENKEIPQTQSSSNQKENTSNANIQNKKT